MATRCCVPWPAAERPQPGSRTFVAREGDEFAIVSAVPTRTERAATYRTNERCVHKFRSRSG